MVHPFHGTPTSSYVAVYYASAMNSKISVLIVFILLSEHNETWISFIFSSDEHTCLRERANPRLGISQAAQ